MELVKEGEAGLTNEKLKALTGKENLTEQQASEIISALKLLVEIIMTYQQEQENKCKVVELNTIYKEAA
jgi:signal-transduction protein with cAMP-binding, CBS, and nucleotidyltransferase domain